MNINVNNVLKSANTKFTPENKRTENKGNDDKGESFLKSFNKFLEKKRVDAKRLEERSQDVNKRIEKDEPKDLRGYLNTSHLVQSYPEEKTLNSELPIGSMEDILTNNVEGIEELFQEEIFNPNGLMTEMEAGLLGLTSEETVEPFLDLELEDDTGPKDNNLNFSIEEAKANLTKALNKEANILETEEVETLGLEDKFNSEVIKDQETLNGSEGLALKSELVSKESLISKAKELDSSKTIDQPKEPISTSEKSSISKLESLEKATEKTMAPLDIENSNAIKEDKSFDKNIGKSIEENTNVEEPKLIDANMLFDRIQNSILGFEENSDTLSPQNIQSVEDSMIEFMKVSKEGDASVMRVRLYPEELGSIDISLKLDKGKLIADIIVASDKIKEMFLDNSSILNRNLIEQNVPIKNINIRVNDTLANLENANGEAQDSESRGNSGQGQSARRNTSNDINNSPIDNMRIESINKRNIGSNSLNILV